VGATDPRGLTTWKGVSAVSDPESVSPDPDASFVRALRAGDLEALGHLYRRHGGPVRTLLLRVEPMLSPEDAADLTHDTFLTFREGLDRYEHQGRLRSWLYGIAVRKAKATRRRRWWRQKLRFGGGERAAGVSLHREDDEARVDARRRIERLLAELPDAQREVLVLNAIEGLSVQDTAAVLGVSENAVSTRLYRARKQLKEAP